MISLTAKLLQEKERERERELSQLCGVDLSEGSCGNLIFFNLLPKIEIVKNRREGGRSKWGRGKRRRNG